MAKTYYKWILIALLPLFWQGRSLHPYFVSVTEIEHNASSKTLEISVKIFTDDFEKTLRKHNPAQKVDLINPADRSAAGRLISSYILNNLQVKTDDRNLVLNYLGYEIQEEAVVSFYEVEQVASVKKISIINKLLYDYKKEQCSVIHVTVNNNRKSARLINPDAEFTATY